MRDQDKILNFLKIIGPTLPSKVAKNIKTEILLASAHLSDLAAQGKVKISYLKIGGSPLYYLPGQEEQLLAFASGNMNPKDFQVLEQLKEQKVLREANQDLLSKVALRSLKDFSVPLHVTVNGKTELFWKWHLLSADETNKVIAGMLGIAAPQEQQNEPQKEQQKEQLNGQAAINEKISINSIHSNRSNLSVSEAETKIAETKINSAEQETILTPEALPEALIVEKPVMELEQALLEGIPKKETQQTLAKKREKSRENKEESKNKDKDRPKEGNPNREENKDENKDKENKIIKKARLKMQRIFVEETLFSLVEQYLKGRDVLIEGKEIIRKNAEINVSVLASSAVGVTRYFCKAKHKKRCDEKDLSSAYMEAQLKKLPLLFLYTGELTAKARQMLEANAFENAIVKRMS